MTDDSVICEPIVSLQRLGATDPVSGHITWGALVAPDLVLAPGPIESVIAAGPFEVLLASASPLGADATGLVERIPPRSVEPVGISAHADGAALSVWLRYPSLHAPSRSAIEARELAEAVDEDGDVWSALEQQGAVPSSIQDLTPAEVLPAVSTWEEAMWQEIARLPPSLAETGGEVAIRLCKIIKTCNCQGPWWSP